MLMIFLTAVFIMIMDGLEEKIVDIAVQDVRLTQLVTNVSIHQHNNLIILIDA